MWVLEISKGKKNENIEEEVVKRMNYIVQKGNFHLVLINIIVNVKRMKKLIIYHHFQMLQIQPIQLMDLICLILI